MHDDPTRPAPRPAPGRASAGRFRISDEHPTPTLAIVTVSGELDLATGPQLDTRLDQQLDHPGTTHVILDLSGLHLLAARGVTALVRADREARARDISLQVVVSRPVDRVLGVLELDRHLRTHPDLDSARRSTA